MLVFMLERGAPRTSKPGRRASSGTCRSTVSGIGETSITVTFGIRLVDTRNLDPHVTLVDALRARRRAVRVIIIDHADDDTRRLAADKVWVRRIKTALMENRFRLVQQPIASLLGEEGPAMFDVVVRMLDEQGDEVLPSEFIRIAERNDLLKNIDRWVIGASISFCATRRPGGFRQAVAGYARRPVAVGLARQPGQGTPHRSASHDLPGHEQAASQHLREAQALQQQLTGLGFRLAIEGFGSGRDTARCSSTCRTSSRSTVR